MTTYPTPSSAMKFKSIILNLFFLSSHYVDTGTAVAVFVNNDIVEPFTVLKGHTDAIMVTKFVSPPDAQFGYYFLSSSTEIILYNPVEDWKGLGIVRTNSERTSFDYANNVIVTTDGDRLFRVIKLDDSFWKDGSTDSAKDIVIDLNTQYNTVYNNPPTLNHDGSRVAFGSLSSNNYNVYLHDTLDGKQISILKGHTRSVYRTIFSPDGTKIASSGFDKTIRLWDVESGETLHVLESHSNKVLSLCFSSDGKQLASGSSDMTLKVWNTETGKLLVTFSGAHDGEVRSLAMADIPASANHGARRILVSGSLEFYGGTVNVWDIENISIGAGPIATRKTGKAWSMSFSPDGEYLAIGQVYETEIFKVSDFLYGPQTNSPTESPSLGNVDEVEESGGSSENNENEDKSSNAVSLHWSNIVISLVSLLLIGVMQSV